MISVSSVSALISALTKVTKTLTKTLTIFYKKIQKPHFRTKLAEKRIGKKMTKIAKITKICSLNIKNQSEL